MAIEDGRVRVEVEGNADEAAARIEQQIADAFTQAMRSATVRKSFENVAKSIGQSLRTQLDASMQKPFAGAGRNSRKVLGDIQTDLRKVAAAAERAFKFGEARGASNELQAVNALTKTIAANFDELRNASSATLRAIEEQGRQARAGLAAVSGEARRATDARIQDQRAASAIAQAEQTKISAAARIEAAMISARSQRNVQFYRTIRELSTSTWRGAGQAVTAFARTADRVLTGLARGIGSTFRAAGNVVRSFATGAARAIGGIGRGIGSGLGAISRAIANSLRRDEGAYRNSFRRRERDLQSSLARQSRQLAAFEQRTRSGILGAITGRGALGVGAGVGAGFGISNLFSSGFERFSNLEALNFRFEALLKSGRAAAEVMADVEDFAKRTRFDLVGVGNLVTGFLTIGQTGEQAVASARAIADAVSFAGGTTENLSFIQRALGQVISTGKLQGDELNQLAENLPGLNIRQVIADQLTGGDVAELTRLQEAGEISGQAFVDAFLTGITTGEVGERIGGAAEAMGNTLSGRLDNMKETFAQLGADIIGQFEGPIRTGFNALNSLFSGLSTFVRGGDTETVAVFDRFIGSEEQFVALTGTLATLRDILIGVGKGLLALLAVKGVVEIFGLLGTAIRFLVSPMGLVVTAFAVAVPLFEAMVAASDFLGHRLAWLRYFVVATVDAFVGLGKALFAFFRGGDGKGDGGASIFKRMGDQLARFVGFINNGLRGLRDWARWATLMVADGNLTAVFDDLNDRVKTLVGNLLGLNDDEISWSKFLGGNDFSNLFTTFLDKIEEIPVIGPVTAFARRIIDALSGFAGDIWTAIFGGDAGEGAGVAFRNEEGGAGSMGTRILNVLEDTFLGPVVQFFRGPFANLVERIGGGVADFAGFLADLFNAIFGGGRGGVGTRIADVLQDTFLEPVIRFFRGPFIDFFKGVGATLGNIGAEISDLFRPLTNAVKDFFGEEGAEGKFDFGEEGGLSGIWGALGDSLGNVVEKVSELLSPLFDAVSNWFGDNFSSEDMIGYAQTFLDFLREAGRIIGGFITQPEVVLGIAAAIIGIIGAAITIAGSFAVGFAQGVADNADEWGAIISSGITAAFNWLADNAPDVSKALLDTFSGIFANPSVAAGITAAALLLGPIIAGAISGAFARTDIKLGGGAVLQGQGARGGLVGGLTALASGIFTTFGNILKGYFKGGTTLASLMFSGVKAVGGKLPGFDSVGTAAGNGVLSGLTTRLGNLRTGARSALDTLRLKMMYAADGLRGGFNSVGAGIAAGIIAGIASFEIGRAAGRSGSSGNVLLAILGGAGAGALFGASVGGGGGAAIGAVVGGSISAIGAAIGASGAAAQRAKDEIGEYVDALTGIEGQAERIQSAAQTIIANILDEDLGVQQILLTAEFDVQKFADQVQRGDDLAGIFLDTMGRFNAAVEDQLSPEQFEDLGDAWNKMLDQFSKGDLNPTTLRQILETTDGAREALAALGLDADDVINLFDAIGDEGSELFAGLDDAARRDLFNELIAGAEESKEALDKAFGDGGEPLINKSIQSAGDAFKELQDDAADARQAVLDVLDASSYGGSFQNLQDEFELMLPDFDDLFLRGLEGVSAGSQDAAIRNILGPFADDVRRIIGEGIAEGQITDVPSLQLVIAGLRTQINEADLTPEVRNLLLFALGAVENDPEVLAAVRANADAVAAETDAALAAAAPEEGFVGKYFVQGTGAQGGGGGRYVQAVTAAAQQATEIFRKEFAKIPLPSLLSGKKPADTPTAGVSVDDSSVADAQDVVKRTLAVFLGGTIRMLRAGAGMGEAMADGFRAGIRELNSIASSAAAAAANAAGRFAIFFFIAGANLTASLASGMRSQLAAAAAAAAAVAAAVATAARSALGIASPSKVFRDIGRDIGKGFIQGIKDAEGEMAGALDNAISTAMDRAQNTAAFRSAQVAATIFDALAPSNLPGGESRTNIQNARAQINQQIGGFLNEVRGNAASGLGGDNVAGLFNARVEAAGARREVAEALRQVALQVNEAKAQEKAIADYDRKRAELEDKRRRGELSQKKFEEALEKLGDRPARLTPEQINLLRTGSRSLDPTTVAGQGNIAALQEALESIRSFGQSAIEAGLPVATVIRQMREYINGIVAEAQARGLNLNQINTIVGQLGLSAADLAEYQRQLLSLDISTISGATNVAQINEQLLAIREFARQLLESGSSAAGVTAEIQRLRDQLIAQATAFGFSATQIAALVNQAGLSNTALAEFIRQLATFNAEARSAEQVARDAAAAAKKKREEEEAAAKAAEQTPARPTPQGIDRPVVENLIINPPSGDPEAIGLAAANRIFYQLLI